MAAVKRRTVAALLGAVTGSLLACSEGGTPPEPPGTPGLRVVAGGGAADTIGTTLAQALVVEVRDAAGHLQPGVPVVFDAAGLHSDPAAGEVRVANLTSTHLGVFASEQADARGRVAVLVQFGNRAGPAEVAIRAPSLGLQTTVRYTVRPGAPSRIALGPADSAVAVGGTYQLRNSVQDRHGNTRADPVTLTAGSSAASLMGSTVRGERAARTWVIARAGPVTDTAWVSVVPAGVLAAYEPPVYFNSNGPDIRQPGRIVTLNTDGSGLRVVLNQQPAVIPVSHASGMQPVWSPEGSEIAYLNGGGLMAASATGAQRTLFFGSLPVREEFSPQFSPDGAWVYMSLGMDGAQRTFWRVRRDGSEPRQVSPDESWGIEVMPSPDPSGDLLVYQTNRATNSHEFTLRILRLSTGEMRAIDVPGSAPRWSPRGDWIAYLGRDGTLRRMRPDASESQVIGRGIVAHPTFSWSPDGEWLVISGNVPRSGFPHAVGLSLVRVATGEVLPLRFTRDLVQPAWRP